MLRFNNRAELGLQQAILSRARRAKGCCVELPIGAAVRLQIKSKEWAFSKMMRQKSQWCYMVSVVWLDITGQLYVLLPTFWTIIGIFSFIPAGFRLTIMWILLTPLHSWEGVRGTLPSCDSWGKRGARGCSGPVEKANNAELAPGCHKNGKCHSMEQGLRILKCLTV